MDRVRRRAAAFSRLPEPLRAAARIAQFLGGEGVEGALKEEDDVPLPCPGQQLRLEQRRGMALFVEVALFGDGPADAAAILTGEHHAVMRADRSLGEKRVTVSADRPRWVK